MRFKNTSAKPEIKNKRYSIGSSLPIGIGIVIFSIGALAGMAIPAVSLCTIDPKLDFGNLLQVLTTLILALLVSKWWRDQHFRSDTAKNILAQYVRDLRAKQAEIRIDFRLLVGNEWNQTLFTKILGDFRDANNLVLEIETTARAVFTRDPCGKLRSELRTLKCRVTSLRPSQYHSSDLGAIETAFSQFQVTLAQAQAEVLSL